MNSRNRKSPCCVVEAQSVHAPSLPPSLAHSALRPQGCFDISEPLPSIRSSGVQAGWIQRYVRINCGVSHPSVKDGLVKSCICVFLHCGVVVSSVCLSDLCIVVVCLFVFLLPSTSSLGLCVSFQFQVQFILVRRDSTY